MLLSSYSLIKCFERLASRVKTREDVLVQRGFDKDRALLAAMYMNGLDPAEEWLVVNRHLSLKQLRASLRRGSVPSTAEFAIRTLALNETTLPETRKNIMQADMETKWLQHASGKMVLAGYHELQEDNQRPPGTFRSQLVPSDESQSQPSRDQTAIPTCTQAQATRQVSAFPSWQVRLLLLPGWEYGASCSPPHYHNHNDDTYHDDLPMAIKQLPRAITAGQAIQRALTRRKNKAQKIRQRDPRDTTSNEGVSAIYGGSNSIIERCGQALSNTLTGTSVGAQPNNTNEIQHPTFPGRVYIGVLKNCRCPVYATMVGGPVVYHCAKQLESVWCFIMTDLGSFDISQEVLQCLQTQYSKVDSQAMYEYVVESLNQSREQGPET